MMEIKSLNRNKNLYMVFHVKIRYLTILLSFVNVKLTLKTLYGLYLEAWFGCTAGAWRSAIKSQQILIAPCLQYGFTHQSPIRDSEPMYVNQIPCVTNQTAQLYINQTHLQMFNLKTEKHPPCKLFCAFISKSIINRF